MTEHQISFDDIGFNAQEINKEFKPAKPAKPKEDKPVAEKKNSLPNMVMGYSRYEAVSSWHKELRRGDVEKATFWLQVLIDGKCGSWYMANYLYWISAEELAMEEVHGGFGTYLGMLNTHGTKADPYQLYYATIRFCKAKKWWECEESTNMRILWGKHTKVLKEDTEYKLDIPHYAHDRHTSKGKALMKSGDADLRYSGMWQGMIWRRKAIEQHGTIDVPWEAVKWDEGEYEHWVYMEENIC